MTFLFQLVVYFVLFVSASAIYYYIRTLLAERKERQLTDLRRK